MGLSANTKLGPYVVLGPLQSGGMGEVYRAHDSQLDRSVALKVLRTDLVGDANAVARFQREAKLASSLNHPHIISIYSVHEADGLLCIAMELVGGTTLSEWIESQKPGLNRILEVFIQIADALAAAHAADVVHRDIKPSNILVNAQGYAKVLDFGLAKHVSLQPHDRSEATTLRDLTTGQNLLGTPAYMSPEQARGEPVDARTDIFSVCVMLYEAVTGQRPFRGDSMVQLLHAVISTRPRPVTEINSSLPPQLQTLLQRGLAKERDLRFANMAELATELRRLRSWVESQAFSTRTRAQSSRLGMAIALVLGVLAVVAVVLYRFAGQRPEAAALKYEQLTDFNDAAFAPALSPDGRMLAFVRGGSFGSSAIGAGDIYVKMLPDGDPIRLTKDGGAKHVPVFTPDGSRILYTRVNANFSWDTWQVPVLGGETTPYLPNASGLTFIGKDEILFAEIKASPQMAVMTSKLNRVAQREVYAPAGAGSMAHRAALSPDRKWVLIAEMDGSGWLPCRLVPFDGSSAGGPVGPEHGQCVTASWSPDGRMMYFSSNAGGAFHIWRQKFPDGQPERLTTEASEQEGTTVTADGKSLITTVGIVQSAIWLHDKDGDRQLTFQGVAVLPKMSPDGASVYYLQRSGASRSYVSGEIWKVDLKSGNRDRVLPGFVMTGYDISPDGHSLVFASAEGSADAGIWIADLDRRKPPRQLTKGGEYRVFFAGNSEIVYQGNEPDRFLFMMKTDGSDRRRVSDERVIYLINVSPDGEWVAASLMGRNEGAAVKLFSVRRLSPPVSICEGCAVGFGPGRTDAPVVSWTHDGRTVIVPLRFFGMSRRSIELPFDARRPDFDRDARTEAAYLALPGAKVINERDMFPAIRPGEYLMSRRSSVTNLYRVILPD